MCVSVKAPAPPPMPEPIPATPPSVSGATTKQNAPAMADSTGRDVNVASSASTRIKKGPSRIRKRRGCG